MLQDSFKVCMLGYQYHSSYPVTFDMNPQYHFSLPKILHLIIQPKFFLCSLCFLTRWRNSWCIICVSACDSNIFVCMPRTYWWVCFWAVVSQIQHFCIKCLPPIICTIHCAIQCSVWFSYLPLHLCSICSAKMIQPALAVFDVFGCLWVALGAFGWM